MNFEIGQSLIATVTKVGKYKLHLDTSGKEAFLFVTDINHERSKTIKDYFEVGDNIEVKVKRIKKNGEVSVSRKDLVGKEILLEDKDDDLDGNIINKKLLEENDKKDVETVRLIEYKPLSKNLFTEEVLYSDWDITIQTIMHIMNSVATRDNRTGISISRSLIDILQEMASGLNEDSVIPMPMDRIYQICEFSNEPLENILRTPRKNIKRSHSMQPHSTIKQMDQKSMDWLGKLPGRNMREKLAGKDRILGVKKEFTPDILENQLVKAFCMRVGQYLEKRLDLYSKGVYEDNERNRKRKSVIDVFLNNITTNLYRSELKGVRSLGNLQPNNTLLSDRNYSRIWRSWQWLHNYENELLEVKKDLDDRLTTVIMWAYIAKLYESDQINFPQQPAVVRDGYSDNPFGITSYRENRLNMVSALFIYKETRMIEFSIESVENKIKSTFVLEDNEVITYDYNVIVEKKNTQKRVGYGFEILDPKNVVLFRGNVNNESINNIANQLRNEFFKAFECELAKKRFDESKVFKSKNVGIDITSLYPKVSVDGVVETMVSPLLLQQWKLPEGMTKWIEIDLNEGIVVDEKVKNISIHDVLDPYSEEKRSILSDAAQLFVDKLKRNIEADVLSYTYPDNVDDFSQKIIRAAFNLSFHKTYPTPRSVAAVLSWQKSEEFFSSEIEENDCILVADTNSNSLTITPIIAQQDKRLLKNKPGTKGIYWERHPSLLSNEEERALSTLSIARDYLEKNNDRLSVFGGKIDLSVFDRDSEKKKTSNLNINLEKYRWISIEKKSFQLNELYDDFNEKFITYSKDRKKNAAENFPFGVNNVYILCVGDTFDAHSVIGTNLFTWVGKSVKVIESRIEPSYGAEIFLEREEESLLSWKDHLPELSIEIIRNGHYELMKLVSKKTIEPKIGLVQSIDVSEQFVIPAGEKTLKFPLFLGGNNGKSLGFQAVLKSSILPLQKDALVKLSLSYSYGQEDPYTLEFISIHEEQGFTSIKVSWEDESSSTDHSLINYDKSPVFPSKAKWNDFTHMLNNRTGRNDFDLLNQLSKSVYFFKSDNKKQEIAYAIKNNDIYALDQLSDWLSRKFEIYFRNLWAQGRTINDEDVPAELRVSVEYIVDSLSRMVMVLSNESDYAYARELTGTMLMLLSRLHSDIPDQIVDEITIRVKRENVTFFLFCNTAAYALGNVETDAQKRLLEALFEVLNRELDKEDEALLVQTFATSAWRYPEFVYSLAEEKVVEKLFDQIYITVNSFHTRINSIEDGQYMKLNKEKKSFRHHIELLLALLRLRELGNKNFIELMSPSNKQIISLASLLRRIDCILFENHIDLFTGVQFSVDKPKALGNMTDIIYALNVYLTGDAGDKTIQVTGFIEEE